MKKLLHYTGVFLCLLSLCFLYSRLLPNLELVTETIPTCFKPWFTFILLSICYAAALNLLAFGWGKQLRFNGQNAKMQDKMSIYAQSQIAKYIPGNVFQYVGRNLLATQYRLDAAVVLKSSLYEIISLVLSALLIIVVASQWPFAPILSRFISDYPQANRMLVISLLLIGFSVLFIFSHRIKAFLAGYFYPYFWLALMFHLVSVSIFLALWVGVMQQPLSIQTGFLLVFGYLISWVLGFVTPGAPGGVGVREAVFIVLVSHPHIESQVLLLVILSRVLTTLGDILFFIEGLAIYKWRK